MSSKGPKSYSTKLTNIVFKVILNENYIIFLCMSIEIITVKINKKLGLINNSPHL